MFMSIFVEYRPMSSVVSLGVPDLVALLVNAHSIPGSIALIPGDFDSMLPGVTSMFPVRFSVGYAISVLK